MRDAINNNPVVQIALLGGLLMVGALTFMMRGGGEEAVQTDPNAATAAVAPLGGGAATPVDGTGASIAPVDPASPVDPQGASTAPPPGAPAPGLTAESFEPGPGLPAPVVKAYRGGDAIALLLYRGGAVEDRLVRRSVTALKGKPGLSVFVARAKHVARYSQIANGVGVSQVPALVVVRPKKAGPAPEALVSYGFRGPKSVLQAVNDALYRGPKNLPYHPG